MKPSTSRVGNPPKQQGLSGTADEISRWSLDGEHVSAHLVRLVNGRYLHCIAYEFRGGETLAPNFIYGGKGLPREEALEKLKKAALDAMDMAVQLRRSKNYLSSLSQWIRSLTEVSAWEKVVDGDDQPASDDDDQPAPDSDDLPPDGDADESDDAINPDDDDDEGISIVADESGGSLVLRTVGGEDTAIATADREARAMAAKVGYQLPADSTEPDLICRDIASNIRRTAESCVEIGRGLLVLKAACAHGDFIKRTEQIGIERTLAKRFMQAADKFSNGASTHRLVKSVGGQTKLLELLVLDVEEIDELAETGQTGELKLDDIACMSVSELRKNLREARSEKDTLRVNLDTAQDRAERLLRESAPADPELPKETIIARAYCMAAQKTADLKLDGLWRLFAGDVDGTAEAILRREEAWIAVNIIASRALDMIDRMRGSSAVELPERIAGQHILTPAEAERWLADAKLLENAEALERASLSDPAPARAGRGRPRKARK
jgi:hypothetical protein